MSTTAKIVIAIVVINSIILFVACLQRTKQVDVTVPPTAKSADVPSK